VHAYIYHLKKILIGVETTVHLAANVRGIRMNLVQHERHDNDNQLFVTLAENISFLKSELGNSKDLVVREILIGQEPQREAAIIYFEGLANKQLINDFMSALMLHARDAQIISEGTTHSDLIPFLQKTVIPVGDVHNIQDFKRLFPAILSGDTAFLIDGYTHGFLIGTKGWEDRGVQESSVQTVVRGPRDAFSETLITNTALIRRRIKDPRLWLDMKEIGKVTKTNVAIMYIKQIVDEQVVEEVHRRLNQIDIDGILESGNIEELIRDQRFCLFPTIFNTERPDTVAANLLEGRVAVLVDGTPVALLMPAVFTQFMQSAEDYYEVTDMGLLRILRYISLFIALLAPASFIAVTTFHQEMFPTTLMVSIAAQREGIPFPAAVEAFIMEITFEILREAGIRMPRAIGSAISIVGALVLGEAAVQAGLISPAMVIVVSITAITSFVFPVFAMSIPIRLLRFSLMALAAGFGLYGIFVGMIAILLYLCSLRSFGVPYMSPVAPIILREQKDTLIRAPIWAMRTRPRLANQTNLVRQQNHSQQKKGDE